MVNLNTTTKVPNQKSQKPRLKLRQRFGRIFVNLIFFLTFMVILSGGVLLAGKTFYSQALRTENSESSEKVEFIVNQGETVSSITERLIKEDLMRENFKLPFLLYIRLNNLAPTIQAGTFEIPRNLTIEELAETLQHGGLDEAWTTIPEGLRKDEIAAIIAQDFQLNGITFDQEKFLELTTDKEFINQLELDIEAEDLEGFLFPDKYLIPTDTTPEEVITILVRNFEKKTENINLTYDDLILASIIEREGYTETDRKMISDILQRRIEEGWAINADATLLYYHGDWQHPISNADKEIDHAYNTYTKQGLPPTPICNPGLMSIDASINPTSNSYYFYIHSKDRRAHYGATLEEHNQNIQKYLK